MKALIVEDDPVIGAARERSGDLHQVFTS